MNEEVREIRLRDLYLAAYLLSQGVPYARLEWVSAGQAEFCFAPSDRLEADHAEQLRRAWVNQTAECEAVRFTSAIKTLKIEVHQSGRNATPLVEYRRAR